MNTAIFSMIAFDYDGTLSRSDKKNRYLNRLDDDICLSIKTLLEHNIKVAIVTGRGKSIIEILKNSLDISFHQNIIIGLYNGMLFYNLADIDKFENIEDDPLDNNLQKLKIELDRLNPYPLKKR